MVNLPTGSTVGGAKIYTEANHSDMQYTLPQYVSSRYGYKTLRSSDTVGLHAPIFEVKIDTNDTFTILKFYIWGLDNNSSRSIEVAKVVVKVGVQGKLGVDFRNSSARIEESRNINQNIIKIIVTQDDTNAYIVKGFLSHDATNKAYKVHVLNDYFSSAAITFYHNEKLVNALPTGNALTLEAPTFLKRYGDTMEGSLNFKDAYQGINHGGEQVFTNNGNKTLISGKNGDNGGIVLRPKGQNATDVQIEVQTDGSFVQTGSASYPHLGTPTKKWRDGYFSGVVSTGAFVSGNRPASGIQIGGMIYDTTLKKPIWWNGANWTDATGTSV